MAAPAKLAALRHLLAERFPTVPGTVGGAWDNRDGRVLPTGIPSLDEATGGLPRSAITELVCAAPSCGSHLFLAGLLTQTRATRTRVALIDGSDSFDPASFADDVLAPLLWIRCRATPDALQAVDLLARDANLGLVVLDLRRARETELRQTPATQWYRIQRAVEATDLALVVETPRATVASAQLRLVLNTSLSTAALDGEREALAAQLTPVLHRQRLYAAAG